MQETCIILPRHNSAFDSGRCPQRAVYQENLFISHCHIDHMGGIAAHASSRLVDPTVLAIAIVHPPAKLLAGSSMY